MPQRVCPHIGCEKSKMCIINQKHTYTRACQTEYMHVSIQTGNQVYQCQPGQKLNHFKYPRYHRFAIMHKNGCKESTQSNNHFSLQRRYCSNRAVCATNHFQTLFISQTISNALCPTRPGSSFIASSIGAKWGTPCGRACICI